MENIEFNEDMKNKINSLIEFVSSIMNEVDCDIEIEEGCTISDGWNMFVEPVLDMIKEFENDEIER